VADGAAAGSYLTPAGERSLRVHREAIAVKGGDGEELVVEETVWGPLLADAAGGGRRAVRWVAHDAEAVDFGLLAIEACGDVACALAVGKASGLPAMNLLAADAAGHIGWTVAGKVPRRVGVDGRYPAPWHVGGVGWDGWLSADEVPTVVDPPSGGLWSGNNRMVDGEALARLGDGNYTVGSRAGQARDRLLALEAARPGDLLELQLDDRALFLAPWQRLMREVLAGAGERGERWGEMRRLVESWEGRAAAGSAGYLLVRDFREEVAERVFPPLLAGVADLDAEADLLSEHPRSEAALWALLEQRPSHLLAPEWEDWNALLVAAAEGVLERAAAEEVPLAERTWGRKNTLAVSHLFAGALPVGRGLLSMPAEPLAGDEFMPRVQGPDYGASQRLVVAPGAEDAAIFHMPGGQSGHPFSDHFRGGHDAWAAGEAAPLLPGETAHVLVLRPESVR
jgi:penicillin amidase